MPESTPESGDEPLLSSVSVLEVSVPDADSSADVGLPPPPQAVKNSVKSSVNIMVMGFICSAPA